MDSSITEGKATVFFTGDSTSVFYNPVQEFNRDLSILVLRAFSLERTSTTSQNVGEEKDIVGRKNGAKKCKLDKSTSSNSGLRVLEALSASGLRSIRYAKEVQGIAEIVANDFSKSAVECIKRNVAENGVENLVTPSMNDAVTVMHLNKLMTKRFDAVDVDPYGSPSHFLDAAVQCVADGGILMVTCTDMAVLCGNTPEACFAKYGSTSIKSKCCHELALRILIHCVQSHANRYGRYVEPLLCVHVDFYVRVFVRMRSGAQKAKISCCQTAMLNQCVGCMSSYLLPLARKLNTEKGGIKYQNTSTSDGPVTCTECGGKFHIAGPIWAGNLHDVEFVQSLLDLVKVCSREGVLGTAKRISGILSVIIEELQDVPLFYNISWLTHVVRAPAPTLKAFRSALLNGGYQVSPTHVEPFAVKTNAPLNVVWDIIRCWAAQNGVIANKLQPQSPGFKILSKTVQFQANFTLHPGAESMSKKSGELRYQPNPKKNWGPKTKAKGSVSSSNAAYFTCTQDGKVEET